MEEKIKQQDNGKSINVLDLLWYLLGHWKWFLLSMLVFGGYYYYQYSKTAFVYSKSATVMIKTPTNTTTTARITRSSMLNTVNVSTEMLQLRSKELMRNTIKRISADVSYTVKQDLRHIELYKSAPVAVLFTDPNPNLGVSLSVTPKDESSVEVAYTAAGEPKKQVVSINKETVLPFGSIVVQANPAYTPETFGKPITVRKQPLEAVTGYFLSRLNIKQVENEAALLRITVEDHSPQRAEDLINALIEVYNEESIADKNRIAVNTAEFINDRIVIIERELGSVESDLERMKAANQGMDIASASQMYIADSREYQNTTRDIESRLNMITLLRDHVQNSANNNELIPNNMGLIDNSTIEAQISAYNTTLLRRNRLVEGSSEQNPIVQDLDVSLKSMRQNIQRTFDNAIDGLEIKIRNSRQEAVEARNRATAMPSKQRMVLSVERQQKVKEELYILLLNKREENAINQAMADDNIRVIDPAAGGDYPIYPSRFGKVMTGMSIGFAVPLVVLVLLLMLDTSVRGRKDLEDALTAPFLGEIPFLKHKKANQELLVDEYGRDPITESFRILRTNISFMASGGVQPQVIAFSSANIGAGKTFSVMNLTGTYSFLGKKVVVVDLDIRKGSLSTRFSVQGGKGITHYLSDKSVQLEDIVRPYKVTDEKTVDVIPIGVSAPNPVELLLSSRLDELMTRLREEYDYVIVDSVPVELVADAYIATRIADLTIFVVRAGRLDKRQLPLIEKVYQQKKLRNMAVLLNGVTKGTKGYRYGYGYGYGYGYDVHDKKQWYQFFSRS